MTPWLTVVIPTRKRAHGEHQALAFTAAAHRPDLLHFVTIDGSASLVKKWKAGLDGAQTSWVLLAADDLMPSDGWDVELQYAASFDRHVLLHVDDGYFHERLCITPCLSREGWASFRWPSEYAHYRIDDHIFDIFHRANRVTYLPDVHLWHVKEPMDLASYAIDNATFHRLKGERDEAVARLLGRPVAVSE